MTSTVLQSLACPTCCPELDLEGESQKMDQL
jgi:hypothetical protein